MAGGPQWYAPFGSFWLCRISYNAEGERMNLHPSAIEIVISSIQGFLFKCFCVFLVKYFFDQTMYYNIMMYATGFSTVGFFFLI